MDEDKIIKKIIEYCNEHGLDFNTLPLLINEPKLVPMMRGIGFEYVIQNKLNEILSYNSKYEIIKPNINAQHTLPDIDILIKDNDNGKSYKLECKLAKNNSFNLKKENCKIKVMRSRTLGDKMIEETAKKEKLSIDYISAHKDSYLFNKFDFVVTNLRNAFYRTTEDGKYKFNPSIEEVDYLKDYFKLKSFDEINKKLLKTHFFINSKDLIAKDNDLICGRKNCPKKNECEFVPNYPLFSFNKNEAKWKDLNLIFENLE